MAIEASNGGDSSVESLRKLVGNAASAGDDQAALLRKLVAAAAGQSGGGSGGSTAWADITGKPTTIAGYGITDALSNSGSSTQNGRFGSVGVNLGASTAFTNFHVADTATSSPRGIMSSQHNDGTDSALYTMRKSRGTLAAPTVVVTADVIGRISFAGYDGSNYIESAYIRAVSTGTIAATRVPTKLEFYTGTNAAPTVATLALTIDETKNVEVFGHLRVPNANGGGVVWGGGVYLSAGGGSSGLKLTDASTTIWKTFDSGQITINSGGLAIVGAATITGGAGNMTITAGTGNSRTLALQTTTSGGTATTALTLNADQSATFAGSIVLPNGATITGPTTSNFTLTAGSSTIASSQNFPRFTHTGAGSSGSAGVVHSFTSGALNLASGGYTILDVTCTNSAATSGSIIGLSVTSTYNQSSGTAANTDLFINRTQTAVGSGAQLLIDARVGGTSRLRATSAGAFNVASSDLLAGAGDIAGSGWFQTGAPTGGTAAKNKVGALVTGLTLVTVTTQGVEYEAADGTKLYLLTAARP